jgi:NADH-quinone oxidoreductase subunit J
MIFAGLAVAGTLAAVFAFLVLIQKSLYSGAVCLLGALLQIAAIYFLLGAQLLALIQVLVYAGAIMVLIVIAIMAAPAHADQLWAKIKMSKMVAIAALIAPSAALGFYFLSRTHGIESWVMASALEKEMATVLFGPYALMTESAGLVILISALALIVSEQ